MIDQYLIQKWLRRFSVIAVSMTLILLMGGTVLAIDPPKITLAPAWRPGTTLDSIDLGTINTFDPGDDFRYVDVEIYVTTSVQFWAVQLTCNVTPSTLISYDNPANDGDPNNSVEPITWGARWGMMGLDFTTVADPYNPATGARTFTATRLGNINPMGSNGYNDTFLLATVRYRAKDLASNGTSIFNCTSSFLNRNGAQVMAATYTAPPPLTVSSGYTISGVVTYQARTNHAGITVTCDGPDGNTDPDFTILTSANGAFSTSALRNQGYFDCSFYGNVSNPAAGYQPDKYLAARTFFNLDGQSYTILPIMLQGGNLSQNAVFTDTDPTTPDEIIEGSDISIITAPANWNKPGTAGDVNGDGKTDRADLAITASNFWSYELVDARHAIFSLPRNYDLFRNSRVWVGAPWAGAVTQFVPNPPTGGRDTWATLSPNGKQVAFSREIASEGTTALFVAPVNNGVVGSPVRITPAGAWYTALAPSWSPDGTRIAFLCSWWDDGSDSVGDGNNYSSGYLSDMGAVCVVDANGRNWVNLNAGLGRIYPPAWLSNNELVYAGSWTIPGIDDANPICADTLCYYNLQTGENRVFDADIMTGGVGTVRVADMPVIRNGVLFYRFYDDNNAAPDTRVIRWAQLVGGGVDSFENRPGSAPYHMRLEYDTDAGPGTSYAPISTDVDYFNIGQNSWDLIFYESGGFDFIKAWWNTGDLGGPAPLEWWEPFSNWVDDMAGNPPPLNTPYIPNDPNDASELYRLRNTVDWVP